MIGTALAAFLAGVATDSVMMPVDSVLPPEAPIDSAVDDEAARPDATVFADPLGTAVHRDDTLREYAFDSTVVKGRRRRPLESSTPRSVWTRPSSMGLPGAVESLREEPGVAFSSDLSGNFSSAGMPVEGSAITWNGAEILWPWHFGGLFGALDDWTTGSVAWHSPAGQPSPSRGGGWLETRGRAGGDTDQVHAAARLGFVAGGAATWGRHGDWGWQATARRTWLDWALDLARDRDWTDQEMKVLFQDATLQATWARGPWAVSAGWFGSEDTLGIGTIGKQDSLMGLSWRNVAVPVGVSWREGAWEVEATGSWSRYSRSDDDLGTRDTLGVWRGAATIGRNLSSSAFLEAGFRTEVWRSVHRLEDAWDAREWVGDSERTVLEPTLRARLAKGSWETEAWMGVAHDRRDGVVPEGAVAAGWRKGSWEVRTALERKLVGLARLDQAQKQIDAASPAWILPPGPAARTTRLQARLVRRDYEPSSGFRTEWRTLGWGRIDQGFWNWSPFDDRVTGISGHAVSLADGWGAGVEIGGSAGWRRFELAFRQILSMDVLRDTGSGPDRVPSRWAPWDQRWRTEGRLACAWRGAIRPRTGEFYWLTEVAGKWSSGSQRTRFAGWTLPLPERDISTMGLDGTTLRDRVRTPYFRLDLTPVRMGREGRWSFWWTLVNLTNATNLSGWVYNGSDDPAHPVSQIPFLPVVFGAQIEI